MRRYRNITDEELVRLGAVPVWDAGTARVLSPKSELIWVHRRRRKLTEDTRTVRRVKVLRIGETDITTNFGKYAVATGIRIRSNKGSMRICDGRVYQLAAKN